MRTERYLPSALVAVACAFLATLFLIACQPSQPSTPTATQAPEAKAANTVLVIFEGPWAIVPDPGDASKIIAIAPKTRGHRMLGVVPANKSLEAGVYELVLPVRSAASATFAKGIFRTGVDSKAVQQALANRLERYAVRLPKPEAFVAETRYNSRVGPPPYPPNTPAEDYVTSISLRYAATSLTGFQLTGNSEVGAAFAPQLLSMDTPVIRFEINPVDQPDDPCHTHARQAFHDMTRLLNLSLYIDFPDSPEECHKKDPQVSHNEKGLLRALPIERFFERDENFAAPQAISMAGAALPSYFDARFERVVHSWVPATYFFHADSAACIGVIVIANGVN
jgi:hypothetical protein